MKEVEHNPKNLYHGEIDWQIAFDGRICAFEYGIDYECTSEQFFEVIKSNAGDAGVKLRVDVQEFMVVIQVIEDQ